MIGQFASTTEHRLWRGVDARKADNVVTSDANGRRGLIRAIISASSAAVVLGATRSRANGHPSGVADKPLVHLVSLCSYEGQRRPQSGALNASHMRKRNQHDRSAD
uniref:Uncharacterized protein n=1 Tax=Plectus sambesii TaxID=2011161 RepID=A0A914UL38_9BILA